MPGERRGRRGGRRGSRVWRSGRGRWTRRERERMKW